MTYISCTTDRQVDFAHLLGEEDGGLTSGVAAGDEYLRILGRVDWRSP